MAEREGVRAREPEAGRMELYEELYGLWRRARERAQAGQVVIKGKELPWEEGRQGRSKHFLHPNMTETALSEWVVFIQDLNTHSGRHVHQGGIALYIIEGQGYTTIDGVRTDWEEGDLLLLPIKPRGVEHQHFNTHSEKNTKWMGLIFLPFIHALGSHLEQKANSPSYHG